MGASHGMSPLARFIAKVNVEGALDDCWLWMAAKTQKGYGMFGDGAGRVTTAHRWSYARFVGPIPGGMQIDHLCRVPACVNPDHLEPVTAAENIRRAHLARRRRATQLQTSAAAHGG